MKKYQFISKEALEASNWKKMCDFGSCEIWGLNNLRLLYDPETTLIILIYNHNEHKIEGDG